MKYGFFIASPCIQSSVSVSFACDSLSHTVYMQAEIRQKIDDEELFV
jgi:hypothetical protein